MEPIIVGKNFSYIKSERVYALTWIFYGLNCLLYNRDSLVYMLFGLGSGIILYFIYFELRREMNRFSSTCALLIIVLPVSFRSIFCTGYDKIPIPWFYIILLLQLSLFIDEKMTVHVIYFFLIILLLLPLMLSDNKFEGFKEYLSYATFCVGGIIGYKYRSTLSNKEFSFLKHLYINGVVFISIGVIIQYIALNYFGINLFRIETYGSNRKLLMFLFYDMSGNTIYMATAVILLLFSKNRGRLLLCLLIVVAMALSSARAGLFSLFLVLLIIIIFEKSDNIHKIPLLLFFGLSGAWAINLLLTTRQAYSSIIDMFREDNGRTELMGVAMQEFWQSPIVGNGLDFGKQMKAQGLMVPHNAIVNILAQGGIIIALMFVIIFAQVIVNSRRFRNKALFWCCILCAIGSNVTPSFFDLRFFTVIVMLCYIGPHDDGEITYSGISM